MNKNWVPFDHILSFALTLTPSLLIIGWLGIEYMRRKSILFHTATAVSATTAAAAGLL